MIGWVSRVHLSLSSKVIIPIRPLGTPGSMFAFTANLMISAKPITLSYLA